jgi:hypothetical protein
MSGRKRRRGRKFASLEVREAYMIGRDVPSRYRKMYLRATGSNHPSEAIKVFCYECQGWDRKAAVECDLEGCPSWAYRPGTSARARGGPSASFSDSVPTPSLEAISPSQGEGGVLGGSDGIASPSPLKLMPTPTLEEVSSDLGESE